MAASFGVSLAGERSRLDEGETPRATDLLRAQRLAERVGSRLKTPRAPVRGWVKGGSGWDAAPAAPAARESVIINVRPPRGRP
jgi:hypothetical protein